MPAPIPITSLDDPRVAGYRDVRDRDLRGRDGLFVVESVKVVERLLRSALRIESLLLSPRRHAELAETLRAREGEFSLFVADDELLHSIAGYHVHGGALALVQRPSHHELSIERLVEAGASGPRCLVVLSAVTHMDNVGSIFRSAAALGAAGILLDDRCCDPLLRKPIRVAMGHSLTMPWAWSDDLLPDLGALRSERHFTLVAVESVDRRAPSRSRVRSLAELPRVERLLLLFGNEDRGLDEALLAACDAIVEIPMMGEVPSLNVAVAAAVALYEWRRGRRG